MTRALLLGMMGVGSVVGGDLSLALDGSSGVVFSGRKQVVRLHVRNSGAERSAELSSRLFQVAGGIAAPTSQRTVWKRVALDENQTVVESLEVEIPTVNAVTILALQVFDGDTRVGAVMLEALPHDFWAALKKELAGFELVVFDPEKVFGGALREAGVEGARVESLEESIDDENPVVFISAQALKDDAIDELSRSCRVVIAPVRGAVGRLPIEGRMRNKAFVTLVENGLLKNFGESAWAQLNLARAIRYGLREAGARKPE